MAVDFHSWHSLHSNHDTAWPRGRTDPPEEEARTDLVDSLPFPPPTQAEAGRIDGRSLRRTHRTVQFATRVSPEFDTRIRQIAMRDQLLLVEILERALDAYEAVRKQQAS